MYFGDHLLLLNIFLFEPLKSITSADLNLSLETKILGFFFVILIKLLIIFFIETDAPVQILYTSPGLHDFFNKLIRPVIVSEI